MLVDVLGFFVRRRAGRQDVGARASTRRSRDTVTRLVPSPGRAPAWRSDGADARQRRRRRPARVHPCRADRHRRRRAARHRPDRELRPVRRAVRARQRVRQQPVLRRAALRRLRRQTWRRQCPGVRDDGESPGGSRRAARPRGLGFPTTPGSSPPSTSRPRIASTSTTWTTCRPHTATSWRRCQRPGAGRGRAGVRAQRAACRGPGSRRRRSRPTPTSGAGPRTGRTSGPNGGCRATRRSSSRGRPDPGPRPPGADVPALLRSRSRSGRARSSNRS